MKDELKIWQNQRNHISALCGRNSELVRVNKIW